VADAVTLEEAVAALEVRLPHLQPPPPRRLVVVGVTACPRCDTTHKVYGYRGAP
jgi:hypothetical protein